MAFSFNDNKGFEVGDSCTVCGDPQVRYSQGEKPVAVARFSVAKNIYNTKTKESVGHFYNVVAFGALGEWCEKNLHKGSELYLRGFLQNNNYEKDGVKYYGMQIVADKIALFTRNNQSAAPQPAPSPDGDGFVSIPDGIDEELPFV